MNSDDATQNFKIFKGVKITPKELIMRNAYDGKSFREKITFQNISPNPVILRTVFPNTTTFHADQNFFGEKISTGLTRTLWINCIYSYVAQSVANLIVYVNEERTHINVEVLVSEGAIHCEPPNLNFEQINLGSAVHGRTLQLVNKGYKQTKFEFDIAQNNLSLTITPARGFIDGNSTMDVKVDIIGFEEGVFIKEVWIKCEGKHTRFTIYVEVIKPKLYICSPHEYTENFLPIMLSPTYEGCRVTQNIDVFNVNMLETIFIIVPEYRKEIMARHKAYKLDPGFKHIFFSPSEGNLEPNESRGIEISFESKRRKLTNDLAYFVCFRLIRVECQNVDKILIEQIKKAARAQQQQYITFGSVSGAFSSDHKEDDNVSRMSFGTVALDIAPDEASIASEDERQKKMFGDFIRICVYIVEKSVKADVKPLQINIQEMLINTQEERTVTIYNRSKTLPFYFEYQKMCFTNVEPKKGCVKPLGNFQVNVTFSPKVAGDINKSIQFNLLYPSDLSNTTKKEFRSIGLVEVPVFIHVKIQSKSVQPKFNPGITPMVTNPVGFMTDNVRFSTKVEKPRMTMQQLYKAQSEKKFDDAKIAFPNDRPVALQPWRNKDIKCKTIFANLPRVIAPSDEYMLTNKELVRKLYNDEYYLQYIRELEEKRVKKKPKSQKLDDYLTSPNKIMQKINAIDCPKYWTKASNIDKNKGILTPVEIYFVNISPSKVHISEVAVGSMVNYDIKIFNENSFPVLVTLTAFERHSHILPNLPISSVVEANEKITLTNEFKPNSTGMFHTVLNVYINNRHLVPVILQAYVMKPRVSIGVSEVIFDDQNPSYSKVVPLNNILNVPTEFSWSIPENSCYTVQPMSGIVPPHRTICCEVFYTPNFLLRNCVKLTVYCKNGHAVHVYVSSCYARSCVDLLEHKIEMPYVPINLPTQRKVILRNSGEEMEIFKIKNPAPCNGITIEPESGCIYGKSDVNLLITIEFRVFINFVANIEIGLGDGQQTSFIIMGSVDFPIVVLKPTDIQIKRIPSGSFEINPIFVENKGKSLAHISFPKNFYPDLTIAASSCIDISLKENIEMFLDPGETVQLYVHFHPGDVGMNEIYLPIVLNRIIGPPEKFNADTLLINRYIKKLSLSFEEIDIQLKPYRKDSLSVLNILTISTKHILRFSKMFLKLKYFVTAPNRSITRIEFKVKNCMKYVVEFCFDISTMADRFDITCKKPESVTYRDEEIMSFQMEAEEEIVLAAIFKPQSPGTWSCNLPIYIKNINNGEVFNYLKLKALYPPPQFHSPRWIFLESVPLEVIISYDLMLQGLNHFNDCVLEVKSDYEGLQFIIIPLEKENNRNSFQKDILVKILFKSYNQIAACKKVTITCSCGVDYFIIVGICASEDIVTNYKHYWCKELDEKRVFKSRGYPYFPEDSDKSEFANYMRNCVKIVERWIHEQALHMTYYYFIPDDMSGPARSEEKKKKEPKQTMLVIMKIIQNLCGIGNEILSCPLMSTDNIERVNQLHCNFRQIIQFLTKQGAYVPQIRSRYLLTYEDYILYMTKIRPIKEKSTDEPKTKETFLSRSKLCWLELILNIFRIMVLSRVQFRRLMSGRSNSTSLLRISSFDAFAFITYNPEKTLLSWLKVHFDSEKDSLVELDTDVPEDYVVAERSINNFTKDLSDALVFIAVTKKFCPYLSSHFKDIFVIVDSKEKSYHNAVKLVEAWKLLNCSFKISPSEIVQPNALQMVFLVTFMTDFFPHFLPKDDISYYAGLSLKETKEITIKNHNNTDLNYEIRFLNNTHECFRPVLQNNFIKIGPNKTFKIKIEFTAKTIKSQNAVVLFLGDMAGLPYCKSIVYNLSGNSNFLCDHRHLHYEISLYKSRAIEEILESPYPVATSYDIWCAKCPPKDLTVEALVRVEDVLLDIKPRTLFTENTQFVTDESGVGKHRIRIYCLSTRPFYVTIVFRSDEVGDFFITVEVQPVNFDLIPKYIIPVELPDNFDSLVCDCCGENKFHNKAKCSRRVVFKIPCQNDPFWSIIIEALMPCVPENEKNIWEKFLESEMGPYILRWLLVGTQEQKTIEHLCNPVIAYIVNNYHKSIKLPATVIIKNIRSKNFVDVDMHVVGDISKSRKLDFSLQSEDGIEFRWYTLEFIRKNRRYSKIVHHVPSFKQRMSMVSL